MKKLFFILAAVTMIFVACKKEGNETPTPVKHTVLAGMDVDKMVFYGDVIYYYTYDADYRLVRIKELQADDNVVLRNMKFHYSDGHLSITGMSEGNNVIKECTLDRQGRITEMMHTSVSLEYGDTTSYFYTYTYDADGHLATSTQIADDEIHTSTYVWENGELIAVNTGNGTGYGDTVIAFETSDAPAQALFNRMKYDNDISELCSQGCFGTLPVHMPSKRSLTLYLEGIPVRTITTEYAYTVENDCLATCQVDDNMTFTFDWKDR